MEKWNDICSDFLEDISRICLLDFTFVRLDKE